MIRVVVPSKEALDRACEIATSFAGGVVPDDAAAWLSAANGKVDASSVTALTLDRETLILVPVEFKP